MSNKRGRSRARKPPRQVVDVQWGNYWKDRGVSYQNSPTQNQQISTEYMYVRVLSEMSINRFTWHNLPNSISERYIEKVLFAQGLVVWFPFAKTGNYLCLRGAPAGDINMYDDPLEFIVTGNTVVNKRVFVRDKGCVPIWTNYMRMPDVEIVRLYAMKLAQLDRSIEIVSASMRTSRIVVAKEDQILTYQNIVRQIDEGTKTIFVKDSVDVDKISVHNMDTDPRILSSLISTKKETWNECLTLLGVDNNAGEDKKERLVSDEVDANSDQVLVHRATSLKARQAACDEINRKYRLPDGSKLNISVSYVNDIVAPAMPRLSLEDING